MKHSEQDSGYSCREYPVLTLTHSLARTRKAWGITNRPGAILRRCMRARGIAHLLAAVCRIFARSAQNLAPAARAYKSKAIDAAADWEVAAGSVSTGDPAPTSAARSKQPSPTHAARLSEEDLPNHAKYPVGPPRSDSVSAPWRPVPPHDCAVPDSVAS